MTYRSCKAVFFGLEGLAVSPAERAFFKEVNPLGFILFARNIESRDQVKKLTAELASIVGHSRPLILIDQEGGRVARLKPPHWRKSPAAGLFAGLAAQNKEQAGEGVYVNARLIASELHELGITVNCAPMADLLAPGSHEIVGDRAYGSDPDQVSFLAQKMAEGLLDGGVLPVLKHIPGHGRAKVDSHFSLPVVDVSLEELKKTDFVPFKALSHIPMGMTAHILYTAIDKNRVATLSPDVIRLVREELGYDGLLMTDDISMKALSGSLATLTTQSIEAGCDVVLHCNGKMKEMQEIAAACPKISDASLARLERAVLQIKSPEEFDVAEAESKLSALFQVA